MVAAASSVRPARPAAAPPAPKRRELQAIAAAARVFARSGYARATTGDIAQALGIRQASTYYYFASKEDALLQVCELGAQGHLERLVEIASSSLPPTEKLRRAIDVNLVAMRDRHDFVKVFLTERHLLPAQHRAKLKRLTGGYGRVLRGILDEGRRAGVLREDLDTDLAMRATIGMMNSAIHWFEPGGPIAIEAIARTFSDLLLTGMLPVADRRNPPRTARGDAR
jgi:AcrR family transcriptional regulator